MNAINQLMENNGFEPVYAARLAEKARVQGKRRIDYFTDKKDRLTAKAEAAAPTPVRTHQELTDAIRMIVDGKKTPDNYNPISALYKKRLMTAHLIREQQAPYSIAYVARAGSSELREILRSYRFIDQK